MIADESKVEASLLQFPDQDRQRRAILMPRCNCGGVRELSCQILTLGIGTKSVGWQTMANIPRALNRKWKRVSTSSMPFSPPESGTIEWRVAVAAGEGPVCRGA